MPATIGQRELALPHPGIQRERMKENKSAARPCVGARPRFEVSQSSYRGHEPIVNVPPARVESEKPTATVPAGVLTAFRAIGLRI